MSPRHHFKWGHQLMCIEVIDVSNWQPNIEMRFELAAEYRNGIWTGSWISKLMSKWIVNWQPQLATGKRHLNITLEWYCDRRRRRAHCMEFVYPTCPRKPPICGSWPRRPPDSIGLAIASEASSVREFPTHILRHLSSYICYRGRWSYRPFSNPCPRSISWLTVLAGPQLRLKGATIS